MYAITRIAGPLHIHSAHKGAGEIKSNPKSFARLCVPL